MVMRTRMRESSVDRSAKSDKDLAWRNKSCSITRAVLGMCSGSVVVLLPLKLTLSSLWHFTRRRVSLWYWGVSQKMQVDWWASMVQKNPHHGVHQQTNKLVNRQGTVPVITLIGVPTYSNRIISFRAASLSSFCSVCRGPDFELVFVGLSHSSWILLGTQLEVVGWLAWDTGAENARLGRSRHFPALDVVLPLAVLEAIHKDSTMEVIDEVLVEVVLGLSTSIFPKVNWLEDLEERWLLKEHPPYIIMKYGGGCFVVAWSLLHRL